jgi:uncharacterized membrane protein
MIISYMTLRKCIGLLGILLAPILVVGSLLLDHPPAIQISISAYYYTSMRNPMEGILCGISFFLLCYHGYTKQDSIVSKLAGIFCLGIAFLPTSDGTDKKNLVSVLHIITASLFFVLLVYISIFLFTKSSGHKTKQKTQRDKIHITCGIVMAVAIVSIPFDGIGAIANRTHFLHPTLILETVALSSFGVSWLTKGELILKDKAQSETGKSQAPPSILISAGRPG